MIESTSGFKADSMQNEKKKQQKKPLEQSWTRAVQGVKNTIVDIVIV